MTKHPSRARAKQDRNHQNQGFSLIELLIVVAIILVIAAIAIPNLIRSRIAANEAAAVEDCRTITTANVVYSTTYVIGYAASLAKLGPPPSPPVSSSGAGLIDPVLSQGTKTGYKFTYVPGPVDVDGDIDSYTLNADPSFQNITGARHFFVDATLIIRENDTGPATVNDMPIQ